MNKKEIYYKFFKENILPKIIPLENKRKNSIKKASLISIIFFILGILFSVVFIFNIINNKFNPITFPLLLFFTYFFFIKSIINIIITSREYKNKIEHEIEPLFNTPIANFTKWPKGLDIDAILSSGLFFNFDSAESSSCNFGIYANTNIIISNAQINLPTMGISKPTLFKGTLVQLELPFNTNNHIILTSKTEPKCNTYKKITSNIQELNKFMHIYIQKETPNFITQELWEAVKSLAFAFDTKSILISINYNTVLIAIKHKNNNKFININSSLTNIKNYDELIEKFIAIYNFVDYTTSLHS